MRWPVLALSLLVLLLSGCPASDNGGGRYCYGDGMCVEPDGNLVAADGRPANSGGDELPGDTNGGDGVEPGEPEPPGYECTCPTSATDTDGDCLSDAIEIGTCTMTGQTACEAAAGCHWNTTASQCSGNSDPTLADTDGDGVRDGCEDHDRDGLRDSNEMNPRLTDTDGDLIPDGKEDANKNGRYDLGETNALRQDTDLDGILDGVEDADHDGLVDGWTALDANTDTNQNGCWDVGEHGESNPRKADSDNDGIVDGNEDKNKNGICDLGETCAFVADTDCDLLPDGKEDLNHNGVVNSGETDPLNPDTDGDGIKDGTEDANLNGAWDLGLETSALKVDTDGDGIWDGTLDLNGNGDCTEPGEHCGEDRNNDGIVDRFVDTNGNGCWDEGELPGESDPRLVDSDGDGLTDGTEDNDRDGQCGTRMALDPGGSGELVRVFAETCAFLPDTDCDGLRDGVEDANKNGRHDVGESDPRYRDSDFDGLSDGCPVGVNPKTCEDKNNNGRQDAGETNPVIGDSDGDGLSDGCEVFFDPTNCSTQATPLGCSTDPLHEDTDLDGYADGEEDINHNCVFDAGETDPRVADPPPAVGTIDRAEYNVCATNNLKPIDKDSASSNRATHDYRLALEIESDNAAPANLKPYLVAPFGKDLNGAGGLQESDVADALFGHTFQSPRDVWDPSFNQLVSRDVYGFIIAATPTGPETLDDALDRVRNEIATAVTRNAGDSLVEVGALTSRPSHDDLTNFRINRNQRQLRLHIDGASKKTDPLRVRNDILRTLMGLYYPTQLATGAACPLGNECSTGQLCVTGQCYAGLPTGVPEADVMGISCPTSPYCHNDFTLYLQGVQRLDRKSVLGSDGRLAVDQTVGQPALLFVVGITPDESAQPGLPFRLHEDQLTRLEDLTGGSAVARYAAETSKACEKKPQQQARADMLWVVDDSRSMQQVIGRLQKAANDAKAVLTSNSQIVDFRVAMTTSNPSADFLAQCQDYCGAACTAPGAVTDAGKPKGDCEINCVSQVMGCMKVCPAGCYSGCSGGLCSCTAACPGDTGNDAAAYCPSGAPCIEPTAIDATMLANAGYSSWTTETYPTVTPSTSHGMPGGGGNFYWEDSDYLDCKSDSSVSGTQRQTQYLNSCASTTGFSSFFNGGARLQLLGNAGFLGSQPAASCSTASMDLLYDPAAPSPPSACSASADRHCERLTAACADGPTVLASQMCDLIRAMGGLPCNLGTTSAPSITNGFRPHSSSELGTRTARRLISKLIPALPRDYAGALDTKTHLRLNCSIAASGRTCPSDSDAECAPYERCVAKTCAPTGNCPAAGCDPTLVADGASGITNCDANTPCWPGEYCEAGGRCRRDCTPVPLVTVFLTDEEDFYFKDECSLGTGYTTASAVWEREARRAADLSALADTCYFMNGTTPTPTPCTVDYCMTDPLNPSGPRSWTARFRTDWPHVGADSYNPDRTGWTDGGETTVKWRPSGAPECSALYADRDSTCLADPCNANYGDSAACGQWGSRCTYLSNHCMSTCAAYTYPAVTTTDCAVGDAACRRAFYALQKTRCEADAACAWDQSRVSGANITSSGQRDACVNKYPPNDCQACKRLRRQVESIQGGDGLVGLGVVGPAYAITRQKGLQGYATFDPTNGAITRQDACGGGTVTWGRGDGQALRDLAIGTLGRTQDVCTNSADGYRPFLQLLISDIAALSAPYRLLGAPIAATIKVGIARPNGPSYDYFEVPRSRTSGFIYNATTNSIAFKSDPVDGVCGTASCSANGVIEATEIEYARTAPHVPRQNDQIFVSYRLWLPVPCKEECADGESCVRVFCPEQPPPVTACPSGLDSECPALGQKCVGNQCLFDCTPGEPLDLCVCGNCGACETCNTAQGRCELTTTDKCVCDPREEECGKEPLRDSCLALTIGGVQPCAWDDAASRCILGNRCMPDDPAACQPGFTCDESCVCVHKSGCDAGFNNDGTVKDCDKAIGCCDTWAAGSSTCAALSGQVACEGQPGCVYNAAIPACETGAPPCCLADEVAQCFTDPETGDSRIICVAEPVCTCTPACNPVTEYCCDTCFNSGGSLCDCRLVPP